MFGSSKYKFLTQPLTETFQSKNENENENVFRKKRKKNCSHSNHIGRNLVEGTETDRMKWTRIDQYLGLVEQGMIWPNSEMEFSDCYGQKNIIDKPDPSDIEAHGWSKNQVCPFLLQQCLDGESNIYLTKWDGQFFFFL